MFASTCIDVVEAHALKLDDARAHALVRRWYEAASALHAFIADEGLDLVDVSTLAELYLAAKQERGTVAA